MGFEVAPTLLGSPRGRRSALLLAGFLIAVAGVAIAGRQSEGNVPPRSDAAVVRGGERPTGSPPPTSSPAPSGSVPGGLSATGSRPADRSGPRPSPPGAISCHDLTSEACAFAVGAAVDVLPDGLPSIATIGAWRSLICGDSLDCPPGHLTGNRPVGSVIVTFVDAGPDAWINVMAPPGTVLRARGPHARLAEPEAWIVRWDE